MQFDVLPGGGAQGHGIVWRRDGGSGSADEKPEMGGEVSDEREMGGKPEIRWQQQTAGISILWHRFEKGKLSVKKNKGSGVWV